jgi:hypothetical protein
MVNKIKLLTLTVISIVLSTMWFTLNLIIYLIIFIPFILLDFNIHIINTWFRLKWEQFFDKYLHNRIDRYLPK